jgi:hypothetical protein
MSRKKRPQYVVELVNKTNEYLRGFKVTDRGDTLFAFMCDYLLKRNMYEGYNFYVDVYNTYLNKNVPMIADKKDVDNNTYEYLQIF